MLVNTTPKYMPVAEVQIACIRRYAKELDYVPIFLATELAPSDLTVDRILNIHNVHYIRLQQEESGFIESRLAAVNYLPREYEIVLPLQEDFLLDRSPDYVALNEAMKIFKMNSYVKSIRLMPSPGPVESDAKYKDDSKWRILSDCDTYRFTFQATLWRSQDYTKFLEKILMSASKDFKDSGQPDSQWAKYCIRANVAENEKGQEIFKTLCMSPTSIHLSVERPHTHRNAVFLAPWPYRPTAVVQGKLEDWAKEFIAREGFRIDFQT
jgi:hypothetical protein